MKLKTLLVLGASTLMSISASAWTKPVPQTQDIVTCTDTTGAVKQYLYNVGSGKFLLGANNYSTRASVGGKGYQWCILDNGEGALTLYDHVEVGNDGADKGWLAMFCDNNASVWVDNVGGANVNTWTLTSVGNGKYKIGNQALTGEYLGVGVVGCTGTDTRCYFTSYFAAQDPALESYDEWTGVSVEAYNAYLASEIIYEAADSLGKRILECETAYPGITFATARVVFLGETSATLSDLRAAYKSIDADIVKYSQEHASVANPIDMSAMIVNATFDTNGNFTGWSGSSFGADGTTSTCAERYNMTFNTYQDIKNLPNGVYKINADGFYRAGSIANDYTAEKAGTASTAHLYGVNMTEETTARDTTQTAIMHLFHGIPAGAHVDADGNDLGGTLYTATEDGASVSYYVPNSMLDFTNYNGTTKNVTEPFYKTNSVIVPVSEGTLRIGVDNTSAPSTCWTIVDNFGLTYYGNGAEAWSALISDYAKNCKLPESTVATISLKDKYNDLVNNASATDYASYKSSVSNIIETKKDIDANVTAWTAYIEKAEQAKAITTDPNYNKVESALNLADYLNNSYTDITQNKASEYYFSLTTEEVIEETEYLDSLIEAAKNDTPEGTDVTDKFITNPNFASGWTGWSHSGTGGNVAADSGAKCAEAWNSANFDIHQDISNAPAGMYTIQVQGFYRYLRDDNAWLAYFNEDGTKKTEGVSEYIKTTPAVIYLNDNTNPMANVFDCYVQRDYAEEHWTANNYYVEACASADDPQATDKCYPNNMTDAGEAFDQGYYKVSAAGAVANKGDKLTIGMKGNSNQGGDSWAIFTRFKLTYMAYNAELVLSELKKQKDYLDTLGTNQTLGKNVIEAIAGVKEKVENYVNNPGDGKEMFAVLCDAYALKGKVSASAEIFAELSTKNAELEETLSETGETASEETQAAAGALNEEVTNAINNRTYTDDEATAKIPEITKMIKMLAIPGNIEEASIENPIELAAGFIENPSFETGSFTGWTATNLQTQSNTAFGKDGTYYCEKWHVAAALDIHQTVTDLPCGTYMITAQDYCDAAVAGAIYAVVDNDSTSTLFSAHTAATEPATDAVYIYVPEGKNLTIGACGTLTTSTWFTIDNFKIYCVGYKKNTVPSDFNTDVNSDGVVDEKDIKAVVDAITSADGKKYSVKELNKVINAIVNK